MIRRRLLALLFLLGLSFSLAGGTTFTRVVEIGERIPPLPEGRCAAAPGES